MIAKNHHQKASFNEKIEKILLHFTKDIKQTFDNIEIFNIFKSNKRILYFLLKNKIIIINEYITQIILSKFSKKYPQYFFDEIRPLIHEEERRILEKEFSTYDNKFFNNYEENHLQGQNHSYLCNLIRNDSVEDFISYVNQMSSSILNSKIDHSIFESNSFLLKKNPSLIEYTAFFGSTQIFQYLKYNGVNIDPSLWLYAIHSGNPEMIHLLEDLHVEPYFGSYCECLIEAIKCHHNDIAYYIQSNLLDFNDSNSQIIGEKIVNCSIKYHNYSFFPDYLNNQYVFYSFLSNFFNAKEKLTRIAIPTSITVIGNNSFNGCASLIEVLIPPTVITIGNTAFNECRSLERIKIPNSVTSIGNFAFNECKSLHEVSLTPSLKSIGRGAFENCERLIQIFIPNSITVIDEYTFHGCSSLKQVSIPFTVVKIGQYAFYGCVELEKISLPTVLSAIEGSSFARCESLKELKIPNSVKTISSSAFYNCTLLNNVSIPDSVTFIGNKAFCGCNSLSELIIPKSVTRIGSDAFSDCYLLKEITLPSVISTSFLGLRSGTTINKI
ncbi:hypothetical protein M9Y10_019073 [Tritrichomonas musculus]|uniref:Surface antigen BspA-like protein n=1 Tax=Tritrichomonas musculus TaxID=1915356 RepID=A0ABR2HIM7_9EUKA